MSKKPKRSRHRVPTNLTLRSDPISERYQTEVNYATNRLERQYRRALAARDNAQKRLEQAIATRSTKASALMSLRRQLEIREYELQEIIKLMQPGDRTRVNWRPVPVTHGW